MSIRINRVYTRSGDTGETGLVGGARVSKSSLRVDAYGEIDELNSSLGVVKELLPAACAALRPLVEELQQELFDLGSELATPPSGAYNGMWHVSGKHVERLERLCDAYGEGLPELRSFILPGGSPLAAALHISRCIARRAERTIVRLKESADPDDRVSPELVAYVNRLSDLLFVLARWSLRAEGKDAPLWVKESERTQS